MKIFLINPSCLSDSGRDLYSAHLLGPLFKLQPFRRMTLGLPLALPTLAALTPEYHKVRIIDEEIENIDFDAPVDLVGITAMTFKATRAYQIAAEFRKRGVRVVMGGIHATMASEEVSAHVDTVVMGEAENIWPKVLADAEAGNLRPLYRDAKFPDISQSPPPRYDLVNCRSYLYAYLQTTRGCPHDCEFCTVTQMAGRKLRRKTVDQIIAEVDIVLAQTPIRPFKLWDKSSGKSRRFVGAIAFIDDNFAIDRKHALEVTKALESYQKEKDILLVWYTQVNVDVGFDAELLKAMADSGCRHLFIGFESLEPDILEDMNKGMNKPEMYEEAIRNIERVGMRVVYSTIFDDRSNLESLNHLVRFVENQHVFHVLLNILTPYPGTRLRKKMEKEGRILTTDPQQYNIRNVVYRPRGMTTIDLEANYMRLCRKIYNFEKVHARGRVPLALGDRLSFPIPERVTIFCGTLLSGAILTARRRMRFRSFWRLAKSAWKDIMGDGTLTGFELLLASCDYEDFLLSEMKRMGRRDGGRRAGLATALVNPAIQNNILGIDSHPLTNSYKSFFVNSEAMEKYGISVRDSARGRPTLVLGGTSISLAERKDFLGHLLWNGFEVAGIENPLGGLRDKDINPTRERPASFRDFLAHLKKNPEIQGLDIVAQSYSAFEVLRVLTKEPDWATFIKSIILINPPGFDPGNNNLRHVRRFFIQHVIGGYMSSLFQLLDARLTAPDMLSWEKERFSRREISGINFWTTRTLANPTRTLRELKDITSFSIKEPLQEVISQGIPVYLFLQADDRVVPAQVTLYEVRGIIPRQRITVTPGGHNDLFFQPWQRDTLCQLLETIHKRHI